RTSKFIPRMEWDSTLKLLLFFHQGVVPSRSDVNGLIPSRKCAGLCQIRQVAFALSLLNEGFTKPEVQECKHVFRAR
ncbi:MAG: hypothetical protein ACXVIF_05995, partial [Halobacteriota archaeon]